MKGLASHVARWIPFTIVLLTSSTVLGFYDPSVGKWLSRDPIGEEGGINLYSYLGNVPTSRIDPLGLDIYELRRRDWKCGCGKHWYVVITDTGIKDDKGRPTITVVNFDPNGWSVMDTPGFSTIDEYMNFVPDPSLGIVRHEKTTPEEAKALAEALKKINPGYIFVFNDCGETIDYVLSELKKIRSKRPEDRPKDPPQQTPQPNPNPPKPGFGQPGRSP